MADSSNAIKFSYESDRIKEINNTEVLSSSEARLLLAELKRLDGRIEKNSTLIESLGKNIFHNQLDIYTIDSILNSLENYEKTDENNIENKQLTSEELKELLKEYDDSLIKEKDKEKAVNEIVNKYKKSEIKVDKEEEIVQENIEENIDNESKEDNSVIKNTIYEAIEKRDKYKEEIIKQINNSGIEINNSESAAKIISNQIIIEENNISEKYGEEKANKVANELKNDILERIKNEESTQLTSEKHEFFTGEDKSGLNEIIEVTKNKIIIDQEAEQISNNIIENIKENKELNENVVLNKEVIKEVVINQIEREIKVDNLIENTSNKTELENELIKVLNDNRKIDLPEKIVSSIKVEANNIKLNAEKLVENNSEISVILGQKMMEEKIYSELIKDTKTTPQESRDVRDYAKLVSKTFSKDELDNFKKEIFDQALKEGKTPEQISQAWNESKLLEKMLKMKPKEMDNFIEKYKNLESKISKFNVYKNSNSGKLNDFVGFIDKNPNIKSLINRYQNISGAFGRVNNFINNKFFAGIREKVFGGIGNKVIANIKNTALKSFAESSFKTFLSSGMKAGTQAVMKALLSGGVKAAATAAGATAGVASGPVGWIILAATAIMGALKKIGGFLKGIAEKMGIDLGIKNFFQDVFGDKLGGFIGTIAEIGGAIIALPALALAGVTVAAVTPIILFVIIGLFVYQLFLGSQMSSLVPTKAVDSDIDYGGDYSYSNPGNGTISVPPVLPGESGLASTIIAMARSLVGNVCYWYGAGHSKFYREPIIGSDLYWNSKTYKDGSGIIHTFGNNESPTGTVRYVYGLDCSGFVLWAYSNAGINLPNRNAKGYYDYADYRFNSISDLKPGDLAFTADFGHVGIYAGYSRGGLPVYLHSTGGGNLGELCDNQSGGVTEGKVTKFVKFARYNSVIQK